MVKYLLSLEEFLEGKKGQALLERAFSRADEGRRARAARGRTDRAKAACLGAGLLLQLATGEAETEGSISDSLPSPWKRYSASGLLDRLEGMAPLSLDFWYGEKGKPYFRDIPFYFNLSHSGEYVVCVLAEREVGADIQIHQAVDRKRLARRFFTREETATLEERAWEESLFFRLWARKEAYGKLTGEGIAGALDINLLPENPRTRGESRDAGNEGIYGRGENRVLGSEGIFWEEPALLSGYSIALCRYENGL